MTAIKKKQLIVRDPEIMFGKPTIAGTRITVEHVLRLTAQGWSIGEILKEHTHLNAEQVKAALEYAADHLERSFARPAEAANNVRWLADECLGYTLVNHLRSQGHDVLWIGEVAPGARDTAVLAWSEEEKRVLLTEDYGFGELVYGRGQPAFGIVVLQLSQFEGLREAIAIAVADRLATLGDTLIGHFTVLGGKKIKSRRLPERQQAGSN